MKRHLISSVGTAVQVKEEKLPDSGKDFEKIHQFSPLPPPPPTMELEEDPTTLNRRRKQIDYGKNTEGYVNYLNAVPRKERLPFHPKTPNMNRKYSRRAWDGLVRQWRLDLHCWTQNENGNCHSSSLDQRMDLGASATDYGNRLQGDGESREESGSESAAETGSTSSSISAAFAVVGVGATVIKSEQDLDSTLTESEPSSSDRLQFPGPGQNQGHPGKRSKWSELNDENLNDSVEGGSQSSNNNSLLDFKNCSWAEEVEEEYYAGSGEDGNIKIKSEVK